MQPITKLIFTGVDGSKYKFDVYPRGIRVNKGPAVYSFLSKVNGNYRVLYIGQTICLSALPTITSGMRLFDMALNIWPFVVPSLLVILTALRQL